VAAGAAQAQRVPGVENLEIVFAQRNDRRHATIIDQAAGKHHVRVGDSAAERPAARHHDAAID